MVHFLVTHFKFQNFYKFVVVVVVVFVSQGMLNTLSEVITGTTTLLGLWKHEVTRVIADRFTNQEDKDWFDNMSKKVGRCAWGHQIYAIPWAFTDMLISSPMTEYDFVVLQMKKIKANALSFFPLEKYRTPGCIVI